MAIRGYQFLAVSICPNQEVGQDLLVWKDFALYVPVGLEEQTYFYKQVLIKPLNGRNTRRYPLKLEYAIKRKLSAAVFYSLRLNGS